MGTDDARDRPGDLSDRPQVEVVEIVVFPDPDARTVREWLAVISFPRVRAIVVLAFAVAVLGTAAGVVVGDRDGGRHGVSGPAGDSGPAGVAAAYGFPLRCLRVTILVTDQTYARADFNHKRLCGRFTWDPTAIFHRVAGAWHPVLNAVQYPCPVGSLPASVQTQLGVCPRR